MKIPEIHFSELDSGKAFKEFGLALGGKAVNGIIQVPPQAGYGLVRKIDFERGLHARIWNLNLSKSLSFHKKTGLSPGEGFNIIYILAANSVSLKSSYFPEPVPLKNNISVLLIPSEMEIHFQLKAGFPVKAIDISVTDKWLSRQFSEEDPTIKSFIEQVKNSSKPGSLIETGAITEYKIAMELHDYAITGVSGLLILKAKTLSLIAEFLSKYTERNPAEVSEGSMLHRDRMLMVERILLEHFEKKLPSLETIARLAALSESTLKRHFKLMYGKNIYEYYLEKKMDYARRLLVENSLSVKEVAYRLGYEKPGNFISIFKKFYKFSPGNLKKG